MRSIISHRSLLRSSSLFKCQKNSHRKLSNDNAVELEMKYHGVMQRAKTPQPLIVAHGMMGSKSNWHSICKVLYVKCSMTVMAFDARNHGNSPHVEDMDYHLMSADLIKLMDDMSLESAFLLGHSMGGKTCMATALTYPARVSGLVVVDVSPGPSPGAKVFPSYLSCMLKISSRFSELDNLSLSKARIAVIEMLKEVENDPMIQRFLASNLIEKDGKIQWRVNLDSIINSYPKISGFPQFNTTYEGPTLFVGGGASPYITKKDEPVIKRLFPAAEIVHIPYAGHWVHSEYPSKFIKVVETFLTKRRIV